MEIIKRYDGLTMWRDSDAEGRDVYAVTRDRDGIAVEPSQVMHHDPITAIRVADPLLLRAVGEAREIMCDDDTRRIQNDRV